MLSEHQHILTEPATLLIISKCRSNKLK